MTQGLDAAFARDRKLLWGLCYRLTGSAADAEDLVQETFARAMERPPARTDEPWRPWLVRVAMNLGRDLLRRRKRRGYVGPWLPSPIELSAELDSEPPSHEPFGQGADARYELMESVSFAFLLALEALSPKQRAVLLLRDVFDYSVAETASALAMSEPNVKTTHHRARRAMEAYEKARSIPTQDLADKTRSALEKLVAALLSQDIPTLQALLAEDVRTLSDGGGEFHAARAPIVGRAKVAKFYLHISQRRGPPARAEIRVLNGLPALVVEHLEGLPGEAKRYVCRIDLGPSGLVREIHTILATRKLTGLGSPISLGV
jgi:RNA polymerase sigma-70 factor (ECF subfamily)